MSKVTNTFNHKDGVCCVSGKPTDNTLRLSRDEGFCHTSSIIYVCPDIVQKRWIGDSLFVFICDQVFYEVNGFDADVIAPVKNDRHFKYLVHKVEIDTIKDYKFSEDF